MMSEHVYETGFKLVRSVEELDEAIKQNQL